MTSPDTLAPQPVKPPGPQAKNANADSTLTDPVIEARTCLKLAHANGGIEKMREITSYQQGRVSNLFAVLFHLQFAVIAANRIGNQCNQHLVRFRNRYCKASDRAVKNGLTKQQVLDVIKEVLY
jgi:hypothetical protein